MLAASVLGSNTAWDLPHFRDPGLADRQLRGVRGRGADRRRQSAASTHMLGEDLAARHRVERVKEALLPQPQLEARLVDVLEDLHGEQELWRALGVRRAEPCRFDLNDYLRKGFQLVAILLVGMFHVDLLAHIEIRAHETPRNRLHL